MTPKTAKTCVNGHLFYKSSDCPVCPQCEHEKQSPDYFIPGLAAPARRALEANGIDSVKALAAFSEKEILSLHGIGKSSLPKFLAALRSAGLQFK